MIPILYVPEEVNFTSQGLGSLTDCISCTVTEERNGEYTLSITYPTDGIHYEEIRNSCLIAAIPSDGATKQYFRIYKIKKKLNGNIEINAEHISYQLSHIPTMPFTASTAPEALVKLKANAAENCPFTFSTDKTTVSTYNQTAPASIRSRLGGTEGSILDVYGGEYEWNNYTVNLWASRGIDRGVTLRYGKNIIDISQEDNIASTITGVCPFYQGETSIVTLPEKVIESSYAANYPYPRTVVLDLSSEFETEPTEAQLRAKALAYINNNNIGIPKISIDVNFVALWQTEEYKDIAPLERVKLCDTVTIQFEKLGINAKAKVIATEYDVLNERYNKITIGDAKSTLAETITETAEKVAEVDKSFVAAAINNATSLITGNQGGNVVLRKDADGKPYEILIMDDPDIDQAQKIWRWNASGLGYSGNGYEGPYGLAMTIDGAIVANFITSGTLNANIIKAGILTDISGKFYLNMQTGDLVMHDGTFNGTINVGGDDNENGTINILNANGNRIGYIDNLGVTIYKTDLETIGTKLGNNGLDTDFLNSQEIWCGDLFWVNRSGAAVRGVECFGYTVISYDNNANGGSFYSLQQNWVTEDSNLYINYTLSANAVVNRSDKRLKTDIEEIDISDAISVIKALKPKKFRMKADESKIRHGFIAQDVLQDIKVGDWDLVPIIPVDQDNKFYGLNYIDIIADLTKTVQNLIQRIESLENDIAELKGSR